MLAILKKKLLADPYGSLSLVVRLLRENGRAYWRRYALVLFCMAIAAGCTAGSAYLVGHAVNEAYVNRSFAGIASVAIAIILVFTTKGLSSYAQTVMLAKIGNQINAENQRRMFDALLKQDLSYFGNRHSSEFTARIMYGSGAA